MKNSFNYKEYSKQIEIAPSMYYIRATEWPGMQNIAILAIALLSVVSRHLFKSNVEIRKCNRSLIATSLENRDFIL